MGQSSSLPRSGSSSSSAVISHSPASPVEITPNFDEPTTYEIDYTLNLPDECLACVFQSLSSGDRNRSSLVCRRWFKVEGESRHRLSLNAKSDLAAAVPQLFFRFDSVTKLSLKCDRRSVSIADDTLILIAQKCKNLTRLKLRGCKEITDDGMAVFSENCSNLRKFSFSSCSFGAQGMNALLDNCGLLEELSVKRLRGITDAAVDISPGKAAASLRTVSLKDLFNGQCFKSLILEAKNLKSLKVFRCSGEWDSLFQLISSKLDKLVEIHLDKLQLSDVGLYAISNFVNLEVLHLVKTPECTNSGLAIVASKCRFLRKLHVDGWKTNRINDEGLIAVATYCRNLQELVLIGLNPTCLSLEQLATNCQNLERLALCGSETVGDPEITCIAQKCIALKKLCIKNCPVSNHGMQALAAGCPNLVKVKVKKCRGVTSEGARWLRANRDSVAVNLEAIETELQATVVIENGVEEENVVVDRANDAAASSSSMRSASFKMRLASFSRRNMVPCTFRRSRNVSEEN